MAASLSKDLIDRYRQILLASGISATAETSKSLFIGELATYRPFLPDGINEQDRVSKLIVYLDGKTKQGRPVLLTLLELLKSYIPEDDDLLGELERLQRE